MKQLTIICIFSIATLFSGCGKFSADHSQMVNPIIGDASFENKFGYKPDASTDNILRISTHLEYAENLLRQKDVSSLSAELKKKRYQLLNLLHDYWTRGVFPKNYDYADQRKPCFIDKDGTICAVGYLLEQTKGRETAENINGKYKYDEVLAMNDPALDEWVLNSGLTKEEFATIQPTYGPPPVYTTNHIDRSYGISSSIIGGLGLSLNVINGIQIGNGTNDKTVAVIGLLTGAGQAGLGAVMFPREYSGFNGIHTNESQKTLSMVNLGMGTTTLILSAWNLIANHKPKDKSTSWNIYSFPVKGHSTGLALNMTRKF